MPRGVGCSGVGRPDPGSGEQIRGREVRSGPGSSFRVWTAGQHECTQSQRRPRADPGSEGGHSGPDSGSEGSFWPDQGSEWSFWVRSGLRGQLSGMGWRRPCLRACQHECTGSRGARSGQNDHFLLKTGQLPET